MAPVSTMDICKLGSYRSLKGPWKSGCPGYKFCELGFYCDGEVKKPCPEGTYGNQEGLLNSNCTQLCPEGFYCPLQTIFPYENRCGNPSVYCPEGSPSPLLIPQGYYGIGKNHDTHSSIALCPLGFYCTEGLKFPCPAGTYGETTGLSTSNCSNLCPAGYFCPPSTISPWTSPCPREPSHYCPEGSSHPIPVALGHFLIKERDEVNENSSAGDLIGIGGFTKQVLCPPGSYCIHGKRSLCPPGRYGISKGILNISCEGICPAGWFSNLPSFLSSFLTLPFLQSLPLPSLPSSVPSAALQSLRYCPEGTLSPHQFPCGNTSVYCPEGSSSPLSASRGYFTSSDDPSSLPNTASAASSDRILNHNQLRSSQSLCLPGHYCQHGICSLSLSLLSSSSLCLHLTFRCYVLITGVMTRCPAGTYGSSSGLFSPSCSGLCQEGFYCPEGSISSQQHHCGSPSVFCPIGSKEPQPVSHGYFTGISPSPVDRHVSFPACPLPLCPL
jgi:hypothetical protein